MDSRDRDAYRAVGLRAPQRRQPTGRSGCRRGTVEGRGIDNPVEEIDAAEIYVPFSWFEPMWLENLGFAPENQAGS